MENDDLTNKFKEGEYYPFKILKDIYLPDQKKYFVLEDIYHVKHLLPSWYYSDVYKFESNTVIDCKIDKINCNGKIFLEPRHPYLKEGELLVFEVFEAEEIYNNYVDPDQTLHLKDYKNNSYYAVPSEIIKFKQFPSNIKAYLVKISKGKLFLRVTGIN